MDTIPYNKVGNAKPESMADIAENEGISEEEWRAQNLPASKLEFRWRYTNKTIHLYERRLRSLGSFNVGPAVQAWVRSRLEWVRDNKLYEMPDGVIVLTIDPEGMVDTQLEELHPAPQFTRAMLDADEVPGTLWVAKDSSGRRRVMLPIRSCATWPRRSATRSCRPKLRLTMVLKSLP